VQVNFYRSESVELTASPTAPKPKIATVEPGLTLALFHAAPTPLIRWPRFSDAPITVKMRDIRCQSTRVKAPYFWFVSLPLGDRETIAGPPVVDQDLVLLLKHKGPIKYLSRWCHLGTNLAFFQPHYHVKIQY
jgi:hypothetical protein